MFRFLDLPLELQRLVYTCYFTPWKILVTHPDETNPVPGEAHLEYPGLASMNLSLTSQTIYTAPKHLLARSFTGQVIFDDHNWATSLMLDFVGTVNKKWSPDHRILEEITSVRSTKRVNAETGLFAVLFMMSLMKSCPNLTDIEIQEGSYYGFWPIIGKDISGVLAGNADEEIAAHARQTLLFRSLKRLKLFRPDVRYKVQMAFRIGDGFPGCACCAVRHQPAVLFNLGSILEQRQTKCCAILELSPNSIQVLGRHQVKERDSEEY